MNNDIVKYLIGRLLAAAEEASREMNENKGDLLVEGRNLAYYEMLDMLRSGIDMYDFPLEEYGLDKNLEALL